MVSHFLALLLVILCCSFEVDGCCVGLLLSVGVVGCVFFDSIVFLAESELFSVSTFTGRFVALDAFVLTCTVVEMELLPGFDLIDCWRVTTSLISLFEFSESTEFVTLGILLLEEKKQNFIKIIV